VEKPTLPLNFTVEQQDIITGSLLGDGGIFKYKETHNPYFAILRKAEDDKYLIWEYEKLKDFCMSGPKYHNIFDKRTNKIYKNVRFITRRSKLFDDYYNLWYPNKIKIVPKTLQLTPLSLAIWFCDDGTICSSNVPWRMRIKLSTHGFDYDSVEFLHSMLQNKFEEKFQIIKSDNKFIIYGSDNATRRFIQEIDAVFPNVMMRKAYWKDPKAQFYENQPQRTIVWSNK
jgi:hypothetical protein